MKVTYKLLWADDDSTWYNGFKENILENEIQEKFDDLGFAFESKLIDFTKMNTEDFLKEAEEYDLLLIDYNLSDTTLGSDVIKAVRENSILTNLIFYSQSEPEVLRDALYKKGVLEGVYFSRRDEEFLAEKLEKVIDLTVKKSQHINALRGLLMAETSDMDVLVVECLKEYFIKSSLQDKESILKYAKKKIKKFLKDFSVEKLSYLADHHDNSHFEDILASLIFDAYKKTHTLKHALEDLKKRVDTSEYINVLDTYFEDIIKKRNVFGHVKEQVGEDGRKKLVSHAKGFETVDFDAEYCSDTRRLLRKHKKNLDDVLALLKDISNYDEQELL